MATDSVFVITSMKNLMKWRIEQMTDHNFGIEDKADFWTESEDMDICPKCGAEDGILFRYKKGAKGVIELRCTHCGNEWTDCGLFDAIPESKEILEQLVKDLEKSPIDEIYDRLESLDHYLSEKPNDSKSHIIKAVLDEIRDIKEMLRRRFD
jgi:formate dehydrogenase maturation protein FdhE